MYLTAVHERYVVKKTYRQGDKVTLLQQCVALDGNPEHEALTNVALIQSWLEMLQKRINHLQEEMKAVNFLERLFTWPVTKYPEVRMICTNFEPFLLLWKAAVEVGGVEAEVARALVLLDPEALESSAEAAAKLLLKVARRFSEQPSCVRPRQATESMQQRVETLKSQLPLISALCNNGMRTRHWAALHKESGIQADISEDPELNLRALLNAGLAKHQDRLLELSDMAGKEFALERTMERMEQDWRGRSFVLQPWRETGASVLRLAPTEEAQVLVDDHIVKARAMQQTPAAVVFQKKLKSWEQKLVEMQDTMENWLRAQTRWLYLQPIFASDDIKKQMKAEGASFQVVDATWRDLMERTSHECLITRAASHTALTELREANQRLDEIEHGLHNYLESKRQAFPRFFFLSNDELLEILSETKDPTRVQPFITKCFEGIHRLEFQGAVNPMISGMLSAEKERVPLIQPVDPFAAQGHVEVWLVQLEEAMQKSMHSSVAKSLTARLDLGESTRNDWMLAWPGQVVLAVTQIMWTRAVTAAIARARHKEAALFEQVVECDRELEQLVEMVRKPLTTLQRATAGVLVVIDVHGRDVVQQLAEADVRSREDFDWIAQMRYYWEEEDRPEGTPGVISGRIAETIQVCMIHARLYYGYEYLGNSSRLVITPLTDRVYRTLCGALQLNLGGAPEGPAGTGKTETTKDLGKALAMACIVFNCSDGLDYLAMAKFFKGLAASGAWACFDEFNRIDLEVLSVIAQQIMTIQRAIAARASKLVFEGTTLDLRHSCSVFITMNPGYAGRSELPDNLKALFRPVAMMVPDYAMISEIILYSCGYLEGRKAAAKLVATYRLCSEQLSSQGHYDYGMRAVMAVLRSAGQLKQRFAHLDEFVLMYRAITDVNLPKFLSPDVPLFEAIMQDLFAGVTLPPSDNDHLVTSLEEACQEHKLQPVPAFIAKSLQVYEMVLVRHGLMMVGQSFGAKTSAYQVLADALTSLVQQGVDTPEGSPPVLAAQYFILNPKSVTMGQLYGQFDPVTHEWTDGVLAITFRKCARDISGERRWVVFDGPVDAVWIENMNTVLDDNKKLCLNSGEIIQMSSTMTMMFEVQDLAEASPATVSRCGMVYMEPSTLGWEPLLASWAATLPEALVERPGAQERVMALFHWLTPLVLRCVMRECTQAVRMLEVNLARALMRLFHAVLLDYDVHVPGRLEGLGEKRSEVLLDSLFLFSIVWSIGGALDGPSRIKFDDMLRKLTSGPPPAEYKPYVKGPPQKLMQIFPNNRDTLVYAYLLDGQSVKWTTWSESLSKAKIPQEISFTNIFVPTAETACYAYLLEQLVAQEVPVLFMGPTGTAKSKSIKSHLLALPTAKYQFVVSNFSAQTSVNRTQEIVDGALVKVRTGVYGPPIGKRLILFIDDLNMPTPEKYGAQPPIELLRQAVDHAEWYEHGQGMPRRRVRHLVWVAAMAPPGGGRVIPPPMHRYLRHYNFISVLPFSESTLRTIFSAITEWWLETATFGGRHKTGLVEASLEVYQAAVAHLLPTPTKSHYTFNLRDLSKVFQGLSGAGAVTETPELIRLWVHEMLRVLYDRLVDEADRSWLLELLTAKTERHFKERLSKMLDADAPQRQTKEQAARSVREAVPRLMFADFVPPEGAPAGDQDYAEVTDIARALAVVGAALEDYNATSKQPMALIVFQYVLQHVGRICRVLRQPGGHALLVGVGGSGRQSLTRLSTFISGYVLVEISASASYGVTEWREDLKIVLKKAGMDNKPTVFLTTDTAMRTESFVEDLSNLLNTGEVPNLFDSGDRYTVVENIMKRAKKAGVNVKSEEDIFAFFNLTCAQNLHVVMCVSPVGKAFIDRLRRFPSLVNCTTIDWFTEWPAEGLLSVSQRFMTNLTVEEESLKKPVPSACVSLHQSAVAMADTFWASERRHFYVTPTSYLCMLELYLELLATRQVEMREGARRYEGGLEKLLATEGAVAGMQEELQRLQPQLLVAREDADKMVANVEAQEAEADKVRKVVQAEEQVANTKAAAAEAIKADCEADLELAMPALKSAIKALDSVKKNDIDEMRGFKSPPKVVKVVMEAVCIMLGQKAARVRNDEGRMVPDYWEASKKLLGQFGFLQSLQTFDKDHIPDATIKKIQAYLDMHDFDPKVVKSASSACHGLCLWVRAMDKYSETAKIVAPKQEKLAEAEAEYQEVRQALLAKQNQLKEVEDELQNLGFERDKMQAKKDEVERQVKVCEEKLQRAKSLISGLGGEKTRWRKVADGLATRLKELIGDMLMSAAFVAYAGPITQTYRQMQVSNWVQVLKGLGVPCNPQFSLLDALGDPLKFQVWNQQCSLPKSVQAMENSLLATTGKRYPLFVDPEEQGVKWVRGMEAHLQSQLQVARHGEASLTRVLENALQFGQPVLIEGVGQELDTLLEPILLRQTYKEGPSLCIKLGDTSVPYNDGFRLYLATRLRNPHYLPEVCVKVTLIAMMMTHDALADQLLGMVVLHEQPQLEAQKEALMEEATQNRRRLNEIEDKILEVLSSSQGNLLEDGNAVQVLSDSKSLADEIFGKQMKAVETEREIDQARQMYSPVAELAATLFFTMTDLGAVDPMYQWSVHWFLQLFTYSMDNANDSGEQEARIEALNAFFSNLLFDSVCRSLLAKDKLLLAVLIAVRTKTAAPPGHLRFLLTGGLAVKEQPLPNPAPGWLLNTGWVELCRLSKLGDVFARLDAGITSAPDAWAHLAAHPEPWVADIPEPYNTDLGQFERLLLLRCMRPDSIPGAFRSYVLETLGEEFMAPPASGDMLLSCLEESDLATPLLCVLSPGSDPTSDLFKLAEDRQIELSAVSLGQGQGPVAVKTIQTAQANGQWVLLQNCHLAVKWLPTLDRLCDTLSEEVSDPLFAGTRTKPKFRLWLTSYPTADFPVAILQRSIKMINEPPQGLRSNLYRSYTSHPITEHEFFEENAGGSVFQRLLFVLCFFHAVVQERRQFGPLGWNVPYEFNESDLRISMRQLHMFVHQAGLEARQEKRELLRVPFPALEYCTGECNYGGRVTDKHDRRTLLSLLRRFYTDSAQNANFALWQPEEGTAPHPASQSPHFVGSRTYDQYLDFIERLPMTCHPSIVGLHANADISSNMAEAGYMYVRLLAMGAGGTGGTGGSGVGGNETSLPEIASDILDQVQAQDFDTERAALKYPMSYENSLNNFLVQEMTRYNKLLRVIRTSLCDIQKAVRGEVLMSEAFEELGTALVRGALPSMWAAVSYPSLKGLGAYVADLSRRCEMIATWMAKGPPISFWLPGFFFTQVQSFACSASLFPWAGWDVRVVLPAGMSLLFPWAGWDAAWCSLLACSLGGWDASVVLPAGMSLLFPWTGWDASVMLPAACPCCFPGPGGMRRGTPCWHVLAVSLGRVGCERVSLGRVECERGTPCCMSSLFPWAGWDAAWYSLLHVLAVSLGRVGCERGFGGFRAGMEKHARWRGRYAEKVCAVRVEATRRRVIGGCDVLEEHEKSNDQAVVLNKRPVVRDFLAEDVAGEEAVDRGMVVSSAVLYGAKMFLRSGYDFIGRAGRMRRFYDTVPKVLSRDLMWLAKILEEYNGQAVVLNRRPVGRDFFAVDAAGEEAVDGGMGGFFGGRWFAVKWEEVRQWRVQPFSPFRDVASSHINYLELFVIFWALKKWGHLLRGRKIVIWSDNEVARLMTRNLGESNFHSSVEGDFVADHKT
ncbi:hypothetical protein CYMTET_4767 [Cymbomonas tetramitiformis]|uniref:Dynein heavy chain n=1 Tax=Cymbomonas tetramitiformis TaxID=36881 RepID=A0AAE0H0R4_9CHLO|nr:hypothetical protein CYMTET_4767 [Cymbomonas tetramitiformis]